MKALLPNFNELSKAIYTHNESVGWWIPPQDNIMQKLQLVSTEVAETTEGDRKKSFDDHLKHRRMAEVELADGIIRMLDIGGRLNLTYIDHIQWDSYEEYMAYIQSTDNPNGAKLFILNEVLVDFKREMRDPYSASIYYSMFIKLSLEISVQFDLDVISAMWEKIEYNKTRNDHKLENRMNGQAGSKSY